jgi:hypothetical protein
MGTTKGLRSLVAQACVVVACTTNVTDDAPYPPIASTLLGRSTVTTAAILVDDANVTWLNQDGSIYSCAKTGCQAQFPVAPPAAMPIGQIGWWNSQAVVAQGAVYFISNVVAQGAPTSKLQSCPLAGCTTPTVIGSTYGTRVVTDGTWLAYEQPSALGYELVICELPGCTSSRVALKQAIMGLGPGQNDFALADGILWFVSFPSTATSQSSNPTLQYCQAATCSTAMKAVIAWSPMPVENEPAMTAIVATTGSSAFVTALDGELLRCDMPTCQSPQAPVDMGVKVSAASMALLSGSDMYVASTSYAPGKGPASWTHCSLAPPGKCDATAIPYPDLVLAGYCAPPSAEMFGDLPFAVDTGSFYWATDSVYMSPGPGNLIVATPR